MPPRWHFAIYRTRCAWIGIANRQRQSRLLLAGGRFAFGQSRAECLANLRDEVAK